MMALRKADRLEIMLQERGYDIFKNPGGGDDGSMIAEIRDLRRYLLLIEAELVARHVKFNQSDELFKEGTPEDGGHYSKQKEDA